MVIIFKSIVNLENVSEVFILTTYHYEMNTYSNNLLYIRVITLITDISISYKFGCSVIYNFIIIVDVNKTKELKNCIGWSENFFLTLR